jgi:hypothetical protein
MESRAIRLTLGAAAWIGLAVAGFLFLNYETQIRNLDASSRAFEQRSRDAASTLADLRAGEQAYVAAGQGVAYWAPRVAAASSAVTSTLSALRESSGDAAVQTALDQAAGAVVEFQKVDARAQVLVKSGQLLTAGDAIFSDGMNAIATAGHEVELARTTERQTSETRAAALRARQTLVLASSAALACLIVVVLLFIPAADTVAAAPPVAEPLSRITAPVARASAVLTNAAALATDFGRARDSNDLERLLGRAAEALDASGIVVWMGSAEGTTLQPALTHGYSPQTIARIQAMPRSSDNAAAAAYRSGTMQIVLARPGGGNGAVVAPILSADGSVGVFSAEIRGGAEASQGVQALAMIIAAHLASVVAAPPVETAEKKAASS